MKYFVLLFVFTLPLFADPISGYTVNGVGGLASSMQGVSDSPFWWADNSGTANGSLLASQYGIGVFQDGSSGGLGSFIVSNSFTIGTYSLLTVDYSFITSVNTGMACSCSWAAAALLKDGQFYALLGASRNDGIGMIGEFGLPFPGQLFNPPSSGVTTVITQSTLPVSGVLGSQEYGKSVDVSSCPICVLNHESSLYVDAGSYQLVFGDFNADRGLSAIAVTRVQVPEPSSIGMAAIALLVLPFAIRRKINFDGRATSN